MSERDVVIAVLLQILSNERTRLRDPRIAEAYVRLRRFLQRHGADPKHELTVHSAYSAAWRLYQDGLATLGDTHGFVFWGPPTDTQRAIAFWLVTMLNPARLCERCGRNGHTHAACRETHTADWASGVPPWGGDVWIDAW